MGQVLVGDSLALIRDRDDHLVVGAVGNDRDRAAIGRELDRVGEDVGENAREIDLATVNGQIRLDLGGDPKVALLDAVLRVFDAALQREPCIRDGQSVGCGGPSAEF